MTTKTKQTIPATYEEWLKLAELHDAYGKHDVPPAEDRRWREPAYCRICGDLAPDTGIGVLLGEVVWHKSIPATMLGYVLRKWMPKINAYNSYYDKTGLFDSLSRTTLQYLVANCAAPQAAAALVRKSGTTQSLRSMCLTEAQTACLHSMYTKRANDDERRAASTDPGYAYKYSADVDRCYHVVTRMGAMREPCEAMQYYQMWKDDMQLTEAERKRICRTMHGAFHLSKEELQDRPAYRKRLAKSTYYGASYIYNIAGERCPEMEAGTSVSSSYDYVYYTAAFGIPDKDMTKRNGSSYAWGRTSGAASNMHTDKAHEARLICEQIIDAKGAITPAEITAMPYAKRSIMALGYMLATHDCPKEIWGMLNRNRQYGRMAKSFAGVLANINAARTRKGLPLLAATMTGVPKS